MTMTMKPHLFAHVVSASLLAFVTAKALANDEGCINHVAVEPYTDAQMVTDKVDAQSHEMNIKHLKGLLKTSVGSTVTLPMGSFSMGILDGMDDEQPVHNVTIDYELEVGLYEVTFNQWEACVENGGCNGYQPVAEGWGRGNRPVINVSWVDVQSFLKWLNSLAREAGDAGGWRLLSEAEWEYVAAADQPEQYSWGEYLGTNNANCNGCGSIWDEKTTAPVGSFKPNAWGLYDMHGNVFEWVSDCWNNNYERAPTNGQAWLYGNCERRVIRGGSWYFPPKFMRVTNRYWFNRDIRDFNVGFRTARTVNK
ncbi:formylglycine-generating enzyme family protein [Kordiimonas sp. SCSIO 12610]|uniref:formylglycine-generating enzyme family protein n=1 Tax=Kordiimonas sp. SCSIO 12610 TaxID=2829597 RepID=UPI00210EEA29|nr:formylglycine-generating enzyme family protein [Kordiimonas sp. SCSIO 12610]UTW54381.1 formylglycine-generating enzyme family protein [Kordiimonas sp. SCSIO 12610]